MIVAPSSAVTERSLGQNTPGIEGCGDVTGQMVPFGHRVSRMRVRSPSVHPMRGEPQPAARMLFAVRPFLSPVLADHGKPSFTFLTHRGHLTHLASRSYVTGRADAPLTSEENL